MLFDICRVHTYLVYKLFLYIYHTLFDQLLIYDAYLSLQPNLAARLCITACLGSMEKPPAALTAEEDFLKWAATRML